MAEEVGGHSWGHAAEAVDREGGAWNDLVRCQLVHSAAAWLELRGCYGLSIAAAELGVLEWVTDVIKAGCSSPKGSRDTV
jgi:hypothetical protein